MAELRACPSPEAAAHVAACEAWAEEDKRLHVETGLTAARERDEEIDADISALRDEIVATRATTLAGLKFKRSTRSTTIQASPIRTRSIRSSTTFSQ